MLYQRLFNRRRGLIVGSPVRQLITNDVAMQKDQLGVVCLGKGQGIPQGLVRIGRQIRRTKDAFDFHKLRQARSLSSLGSFQQRLCRRIVVRIFGCS